MFFWPIYLIQKKVRHHVEWTMGVFTLLNFTWTMHSCISNIFMAQTFPLTYWSKLYRTPTNNWQKWRASNAPFFVDSLLSLNFFLTIWLWVKRVHNVIFDPIIFPAVVFVLYQFGGSVSQLHNVMHVFHKLIMTTWKDMERLRLIDYITKCILYHLYHILCNVCFWKSDQFSKLKGKLSELSVSFRWWVHKHISNTIGRSVWVEKKMVMMIRRYIIIIAFLLYTI
jgi:hypothetical protein